MTMSPGCRQSSPAPVLATCRPSPPWKEQNKIEFFKLIITARCFFIVKPKKKKKNVLSLLFLLYGLDPVDQGLFRFIWMYLLRTVQLWGFFNNLRKKRAMVCEWKSMWRRTEKKIKWQRRWKALNCKIWILRPSHIVSGSTKPSHSQNRFKVHTSSVMLVISQSLVIIITTITSKWLNTVFCLLSLSWLTATASAYSSSCIFCIFSL